MKKFIATLFFLCFSAFLPKSALAWKYPLDHFIPTGNGLWDCSVKCFHLGEDLRAAPDDSVYSIGDGTVMYVDRRTSFGTVILIEHENNGDPFVSLYGHLGFNTADPVTDDIFVNVGDVVSGGDRIGRIGKRDENGGWPPHLHLGLKRGAYTATHDGSCTQWGYSGYSRKAYAESNACFCDLLSKWIDPAEFFGVEEPHLRITAGRVTPQTGVQGQTSFVYDLTAAGGRRGPIHADVLIRNPVLDREFTSTMTHVNSINGVHRYSYSQTLRDIGSYQYRFRVSTCAAVAEDEAPRSGPNVNTLCVPSTEVCDLIDNDCDGATDELVPQRPCSTECNTGVETCVNGAFENCTAWLPQPEVCDRRDNDCDGATDEDISRACSTACGEGFHRCLNGQWSACDAPRPATEICNRIDDDCDGQTDENASIRCINSCGNVGEQRCVNGRLQECNAAECPPPPPPPACTPSTEVCDNRDNDCDGMTDEWLTRECLNNCGHVGTQTCVTGAWNACNASACPPPPPPPLSCTATTEVCDGQDNDCDERIDENIIRNCSNECGNRGIEECATGVWLPCTAAACPPPPPPPPACTPSAEVCDNRDNDCDGQTDESVTLGCMNECGNSGEQVCMNGVWGACNALACPPPPPACTPEAEACDNRDNDCDGATDENVTRSCSNECGNAGTQTCGAGSFGTCTAAACPPPPPQPLETPGLSAPADGYIAELPVGYGSNVTIRWNTVSSANEYEYEIRFTDGAVLNNRTTTGISYRFPSQSSYRAKQISWRVRARSADNRTSNWSSYRTFFFADPIGHIFKCEEATCPVPGAYYQVTDEVYEEASPPRLTLQWVTYECLAGRPFDVTLYSYIANYRRSASRGGCP